MVGWPIMRLKWNKVLIWIALKQKRYQDCPDTFFEFNPQSGKEVSYVQEADRFKNLVLP